MRLYCTLCLTLNTNIYINVMEQNHFIYNTQNIKQNSPFSGIITPKILISACFFFFLLLFHVYIQYTYKCH